MGARTGMAATVAGTFRSRIAVAAMGVAVLAGSLWAAATPASAVVTGGCTGSGTFEKGTKARGSFTESAEKIPPGTVIEIPLEDRVHWTGTVPVPATDRQISGYVAVKLPSPFGHVTIDSWGGQSGKNTNSGVKHYTLPSLVPRGTVFYVYGTHVDGNGATCAGFVLIKVEGGAFGTPLTAISLALTGAFAVLAVLVGRARKVVA